MSAVVVKSVSYKSTASDAVRASLVAASKAFIDGIRDGEEVEITTGEREVRVRVLPKERKS